VNTRRKTTQVALDGIGVAPVSLVSIAVAPSSASIPIGTTQRFTATGSYSDGTTKDLTSTATWSSSNTAVGTVNSSGLATGIAAGSATITSAVGATTGSGELAVISLPRAAAAITDSLGKATLNLGLNLGGTALPIQILDEDTGRPLFNLAVGAALVPSEPGRVLVLIADSSQAFPMQFAVIESQPLTSSSAPASHDIVATTQPVTIRAGKGSGAILTQVVQALQTGILGSVPPPPPDAGDLAKAFYAAIHALTTTPGIVVPPPLGGLCSTSIDAPMTPEAYKQKVEEELWGDTATAELHAIIDIIAEETLTKVTFASAGGELFVGAAPGALALLYEQEGATSVIPVTVSCGGGIIIKMPIPVFPSGDGVVSKIRVSRKGIRSGGRSFSRGALYELLSNPIYIGEIRHKQERHPGQHEAILERELWEKVQQCLLDRAARTPEPQTKAPPSPLAGKVFDETGGKCCNFENGDGGRPERNWAARSQAARSNSWSMN
jgi:hypothetical protein